MLAPVDEQSRNSSRSGRWRRLVGILAIVLAVSISWAILAEYFLHLDRRNSVLVPLGLLLVVAYWVPAWGAIGSWLDNQDDPGRRGIRGAGCLALAFVVFLLICALAVILFTR
jgi:hypothetical protein